MEEVNGLEVIQGDVRSEPLNRNFSQIETIAHQAVAETQETKSTIDRMRAMKFDLYPTYYGTMTGYRKSVMQSFIVMPDGTLFMSQVGVDNNPGIGESFTINRLDGDGHYLDKMEIVHGGHGVNIQAWKSGGDTLLTFVADVETGYKIKQIPYRPNSRIDVKSTGGTIPKYGTGTQLIAIDRTNNKIAVSTKTTADYWNVTQVYNYDEYLKGNAQPVGTVTGTGTNGTLQGFGLIDNTLYWWVGDIGKRDTIKLYLYNTDRGTLMNTYFYPDIAKDYSTTEPEGLYVYQDGNGDVSLFVGVSSGEVGFQRVNMIYAWHSNENEMRFTSSLLQQVQSFKMVESDGFALMPSPLPNKLSQLARPGMYYFRTADWLSFSDIPDHYRVQSGWWMYVYPRSRDVSVIQEAFRNTTTRDDYRIYRIVRLDGTTTEWRPVKSERVSLWTGDSRGDFKTSFKLSDSLNNYDYIYFRIQHEGGANSDDRYVDMRNWGSNDLIFQTHNIGDSATSMGISFFEYCALFSSDRTSFTNKRSTRITISGSGNLSRVNDDDSIGLRAIIGVKL